ncbi:SCP2 sterol-binding domain-containing protein [Aquihabitans daechungensis]|uniref:SCP2 sterol-binding domain-containing protein n=1 Tax=Aquihabitans daechungensis TaxID=1052257 RepID=UPI003BA031D3
MMLTFLSDEWIGALHDAAATDADLAARTREVSLTIEQEVTGAPDGDVRYHLTFERGAVAVTPGPAPEATVRFRQDYATAASIAMGHGSAQRAFMTGRLRVGGDLRVLLDHSEVLAQLDDVFAGVRARTTPPVVTEAAPDAPLAPGEPTG